MLTLKTQAKVTKVLKKSSSPCFAKLQERDIITFSCPIEYSGRSRNGTYATYIHCKNERTFGEGYYSFNQLARVLNCCELEEI